jgi:hypothetical protein
MWLQVSFFGHRCEWPINAALRLRVNGYVTLMGTRPNDRRTYMREYMRRDERLSVYS